MKIVLISLLLIHLLFTIDTKLPTYAITLAKKYNISITIAENWSFAESTHCKFSTRKGYFGRYNIGKDLLDDYCRICNIDFKKTVTNVRKYLENDYNNCKIAYTMFNFYTETLRFSQEEFIQMWLFGAKKIYEENRWSYVYQKKVFGHRKDIKKRYDLYKKYCLVDKPK